MIYNPQTNILRSGCGIAEYRGTAGTPKEVLEGYAKSRSKKCNSYQGITNAHNFVVFTVNVGHCKAFGAYVRKHKLGKVLKTQSVININHGGWLSKDGSEIFAILYTPDHEALTEWYQENFDKDFELKDRV